MHISPDRTVMERRAYKKILDELKLKRETEPDKFHFIRNNKIVSTSEKRESDLFLPTHNSHVFHLLTIRNLLISSCV